MRVKVRCFFVEMSSKLRLSSVELVVGASSPTPCNGGPTSAPVVRYLATVVLLLAPAAGVRLLARPVVLSLCTSYRERGLDRRTHVHTLYWGVRGNMVRGLFRIRPSSRKVKGGLKKIFNIQCPIIASLLNSTPNIGMLGPRLKLGFSITIIA